MTASLVAWLAASAAGSAAAKGFFELGTAPYWGALLVAAQGLVLRRHGVPYGRWLVWSAGGWALGALLGSRLISAAIHGVVATVSGQLGTPPTDLLQAAAVFSILGAAELGALGAHMPARLTWVALNALAGAVIAYIESPLRLLLFAPVAAEAGVPAAEAAVGAALGAVYGAITAPQILRIRPVTRRPRAAAAPRR